MTSATPKEFIADLNSAYPLSPENRAYFKDNGYLKLKHVLQPETIAYYSREITAQVSRLNEMDLPMEKRTTYQKAFLQIMNIWTQSETVKEMVFSRKLARIAAELMEVMRSTSTTTKPFTKSLPAASRPGMRTNIISPSVSSDRTVTAWIPLQATPPRNGPALAFARKTHRMSFGRDLEIQRRERKIGPKVAEERPRLTSTKLHLRWEKSVSTWAGHSIAPDRTAPARPAR